MGLTETLRQHRVQMGDGGRDGVSDRYSGKELLSKCERGGTMQKSGTLEVGLGGKRDTLLSQGLWGRPTPSPTPPAPSTWKQFMFRG